VLFERLEALDPAAAAKMEPTNRRRVVRALEVTLGSGRPFSSFGPGVDSYPPSAVIQIGLRWPRAVLSERIAARVSLMISAGFVAEVEALSAGGFSRTASRALGYREILDALAGRISQDEAIDTIIARTRQFAVRQERWFRRDPRVRWIDVEHDPVAEATQFVIDALDT
jgi:tRNA dimethylallyltransferase